MKPKNIRQQRLESNRFTYTQIGLITALTLVLLAFEWESPVKPIVSTDTRTPVSIDEITVINTGVKPPAPPLPPPPPITVFISTEDPTAPSPDDIFDAGINPTDKIDFVTPVPPPPPDPGPDESEPFIIVEAMPEFPGGEQARVEYLANHVKYPQMARESHIEGPVYIEFVVEKDGSISNTKLLRGIGGGCDEEALRVVRNMPKWKPGHQLNKPVKVRLTMTIKFILK